jgi:o-succinylbenzoate---CoA ligase
MPVDTSLPDWVSYRARTTPSRLALMADGRSWTFAEMDHDATRMAHGLVAHGVRRGDRVAALLHNGPAPAILVHAVQRLGAVLVPLNVRLSGAELAWQLGDSEAKLLITDARTAGIGRDAAGSLSRLPVMDIESQNDIIGSDRGFEHISTHSPDDVLAIIYTSGTTGRPKGAMLTFGNFWWSAIGSQLNMGMRDDDRWLACLPLFHVGGLSIILRSAISGFGAVIHDGFDANAVNRSIDDERITIVSVVANMLQRMLDARGDRAYPSTLRCVLLGGGPAPQALLERCAAAHIPVVQTYGLTETTSQLATLAPEDALRKLGSSGKPLYPNEMRIANDDMHETAQGEPGEIVVRGPVVMAGYSGQPQATAEVIADGWLRTGDIGRVDDDGYLYVLDRRDDLIITGGENVYPAEVEAVLLSHPAVAEAGVAGMVDERWGQRVVAFVRMRDDATAASSATVEALKSHCLRELARYKVPSEIWLVTEALPRTASGKLRRTALRDLTIARDI